MFSSIGESPHFPETHNCDSTRVAYVVPTLNQGGYERLVSHLCNHLDRNKFSPIVICLSKTGPAAKWITSDDVPIVELHKKSGNDWKLVGRLATVLREYAVEIVQSHNWGTLLETCLARRRARTRVHIHAERGTVLGTIQRKGLRQRIRGVAMRWALNRADSVISNAHSVASRVEEACGYHASHVNIIPNGVECPTVEDASSVRHSIRQQLGISESAFVAGSVGRLHPVKGFDVAVRAMQHLIDDDREFHFILVGGGSEQQKLEDLIISKGLETRVHLVGESHQIGRWLAAMDTFVNSSHSEGMSQSLVEAMSFGLPLIATRVGDNDVVVGKKEQACGLIVPPDQPSAIAASLRTLAVDDRQRKQFASNALANYSNNYRFAEMISRMQSHYHDCLQSTNSAKILKETVRV